MVGMRIKSNKLSKVLNNKECHMAVLVCWPFIVFPIIIRAHQIIRNILLQMKRRDILLVTPGLKGVTTLA